MVLGNVVPSFPPSIVKLRFYIRESPVFHAVNVYNRTCRAHPLVEQETRLAPYPKEPICPLFAKLTYLYCVRSGRVSLHHSIRKNCPVKAALIEVQYLIILLPWINYYK